MKAFILFLFVSLGACAPAADSLIDLESDLASPWDQALFDDCLDLCNEEQALHCAVFNRGDCRNQCYIGGIYGQYPCRLDWRQYVECKRAYIDLLTTPCTGGEPTVELVCDPYYDATLECWATAP